ncbi:YdcF family protein [Neisseria zoodegmatis]|uniref:Multidrug MFS transporter n=1 Tax=Neisseria zoodegmatis TaxID=326523 RepID=A0A1X3CM72_9NEIS|nr:YdcF family protein [Neisseria zoodegmatis]OSI08501.1 multidrug MFS transporter [Neisseria zoodegmatis]SNU78811.1 Periplasmic protein [Neisseria zoodegmatis]SUA43845.1 Periplasmic protein [Neisseria zoodegmatis]
MSIPIFRSRNGLRYHLLHGIMLSLLLVLFSFACCIWSVYHTGNQTLPAGVRADAAVVLGAAAWDKRPSPVFQERINHAIALYQSKRVEKLVFTGGTPKKGFMTEAEVGRRYAIKQGVPAHDILFENTSRNTYDNLYNIVPLLRDHGIRTIIIVSDPYHTARAAAIAKDLELNAAVSGTPTSRYTASQKKTKFLFQESYALFLYYAEHWGNSVLRFFGLR